MTLFPARFSAGAVVRSGRAVPAGEGLSGRASLMGPAGFSSGRPMAGAAVRPCGASAAEVARNRAILDADG